MSGLVSDRAIEHEGKIIGHVREGGIFQGGPPGVFTAFLPGPPSIRNARQFPSREAAVAWLMEQHAKEQA